MILYLCQFSILPEIEDINIGLQYKHIHTTYSLSGLELMEHENYSAQTHQAFSLRSNKSCVRTQEFLMINQIYSHMHAKRMMSKLRTNIASNPVFSHHFPMECVLQPIDPVFN